MVDATAQTDAGRVAVLLILALLVGIGPAAAQQQADTTFQPVVTNPAFAPGEGPVVVVDEAHHNFHLDTLQPPADLFRRADGRLRDHAITNGCTAAERVDSVRSFTGQAFRAGPAAEPLMVMNPRMVSLMPDVAWQFDETTRRVSVAGWYQGAEQNQQFLLNVMRWLSGANGE